MVIVLRAVLGIVAAFAVLAGVMLALAAEGPYWKAAITFWVIGGIAAFLALLPGEPEGPQTKD